MRTVWIDEGSEPEYAKCRAHGITHLSRSARDPRTTVASLEADRAHGFECEIYWASTWDAELTPDKAAELMNQRWLRLNGPNRGLAVQFDVEQHDPAYVRDLLARWRQLRPRAATSWTLEGFQGGWVRTMLDLGDFGVKLVPQAYAGDMTPFDTLAVVDDLLDFVVPYERIVPFHDAARLYRGWKGWAFTQARLA